MLAEECQVIINYFEECFKNLPDTNDMISRLYHIDDSPAVTSVLNFLFQLRH